MSQPHYNEPVVGFRIPIISDVAEAIADVATSVWDRIPGSEWVGNAIDTATGPIGDFMKGAFREFAKTGVGETVIRAFSIAAQQALYVVPVVGGALAFATWSIPGLAKGQAFDEAMTKEFVYRCEQVGQYFAGKVGAQAAKEATAAMGQQFAAATQKLSEAAKKVGAPLEQAVKSLGVTPEQVASELGIRADVAAQAIGWAAGQAVPRLEQAFDLGTGELKPEFYWDANAMAPLFKPSSTVKAIGRPSSPAVTRQSALMSSLSAPSLSAAVLAMPKKPVIAKPPASTPARGVAAASTAAEGEIAGIVPIVLIVGALGLWWWQQQRKR